MNKMPNNIKSSYYMLISAFSFSIGGLFSKLCLVHGLSLSITIFSRFFIPFIIFLIFFLSSKKLKKINWENAYVHIVRASFLTASQGLLFLSMSKLSLSESMILYNTGPLFIALYDIFTKKQIKIRVIISLLIGSFGIALMLQIQNDAYNIFVLTGLASGLCFAGSQILLWRLTKIETQANIMFLVYLFSSVFSLLLLLKSHPTRSLIQHCHLSDVIFLLCIGIFSILNQTFKGYAYRIIENASTVSPIIYFSILISVILDFLIFHQTPNAEIILGGVFTISSLFLLLQEKSNDKNSLYVISRRHV